MFGTNTVNSGLSLGRVLSGISKSLNFANQVIPIYQQAKPMISNARKIMGAIKEFSHANVNTINLNNKTSNNVKSQNKSNSPFKGITNPVFFQ